MKSVLKMIVITASLGNAFFLSMTPDSTVAVYPVAIVGNKAILSPELDRAVLVMHKGKNFADSSELWRVYAEVLNELIDEEVFYQSAIAESISVDAKAIDAEFKARWDSVVAQFGSEPALEKQLAQEGYSLSQFKMQMRRQIEAGYLKQMCVRKYIGQIDITDAEVVEFFNEHKDEIPPIPAKIGLWSRKFGPPSEDTLWIIAFAKSEIAMQRLSVGEDFAKIAKELSEDTKTSSNGGELGVIPESELPEHFRNAIGKLKTGQISEPIKGDRGVHILKVINRSGDKIKLAHIFFKLPSIQEGALWKAQSFVQSNPDITQFDTTQTEWFPFSTFLMWLSANNFPVPETTGSSIKRTILPPIIMPGVDTSLVYYVAYFQPEKRPLLPDDREIITNYATMQKFREKLQNVALRLRKKIYIEIKDERLKLN